MNYRSLTDFTSSRYFTIFFRCGFFSAIVVVFYFATAKIESSLPGGYSDKFWHGFTFFILGWLSDLAYPGHDFFKKKFFPLLMYGVFIEIVQYFIPYRSFSIPDMVADTLGLLIYVIIFKYLFSHIKKFAS